MCSAWKGLFPVLCQWTCFFLIHFLMVENCCVHWHSNCDLASGDFALRDHEGKMMSRIASQLSCKDQLAGPVSKPKGYGDSPSFSLVGWGCSERQGNIWHVKEGSLAKMWARLSSGLTDRDPMTQHQWFFFLFLVTLIVKDNTYFFLVISQLHIKNFYCGMVVKIIQHWYIFSHLNT